MKGRRNSPQATILRMGADPRRRYMIVTDEALISIVEANTFSTLYDRSASVPGHTRAGMAGLQNVPPGTLEEKRGLLREEA